MRPTQSLSYEIVIASDKRQEGMWADEESRASKAYLCPNLLVASGGIIVLVYCCPAVLQSCTPWLVETAFFGCVSTRRMAARVMQGTLLYKLI